MRRNLQYQIQHSPLISLICVLIFTLIFFVGVSTPAADTIPQESAPATSPSAQSTVSPSRLMKLSVSLASHQLDSVEELQRATLVVGRKAEAIAGLFLWLTEGNDSSALPEIVAQLCALTPGEGALLGRLSEAAPLLAEQLDILHSLAENYGNDILHAPLCAEDFIGIAEEIVRFESGGAPVVEQTAYAQRRAQLEAAIGSCSPAASPSKQ